MLMTMISRKSNALGSVDLTSGVLGPNWQRGSSLAITNERWQSAGGGSALVRAAVTALLPASGAKA